MMRLLGLLLLPLSALLGLLMLLGGMADHTPDSMMIAGAILVAGALIASARSGRGSSGTRVAVWLNGY